MVGVGCVASKVSATNFGPWKIVMLQKRRLYKLKVHQRDTKKNSRNFLENHKTYTRIRKKNKFFDIIKIIHLLFIYSFKNTSITKMAIRRTHGQTCRKLKRVYNQVKILGKEKKWWKAPASARMVPQDEESPNPVTQNRSQVWERPISKG